MKSILNKITGFMLNSFVVLVILTMLCCSLTGYGQTAVGGDITTDVVYAASGNPYIVTENLVIKPGISLTIQPGVILRFFVGAGIICNGNLIALGTPQSPIRMIEKDPQDTWPGIVFNNSITKFDVNGKYLSGSILSNVSIKNAYVSLTLDANSSILIENSSVSNCFIGISLRRASNNILRNNFIDKCDYGIYLTGFQKNEANKIVGNIISNCRYAGILINNKGELSNQNTIAENRIFGCSTGIQIGSYDLNGSGSNRIENNYLFSNKNALEVFQDNTLVTGNYFTNNANGILCWKSKSDSISANIFTGNSQYALTLTAGSSLNYITRNSFSGNNGAIWIKSDSIDSSLNNSVLYNTIQNNPNHSILIENTPQDNIHFNNIITNSNFRSFENLSSGQVLATENYWGTLREAAIDSIIYDKFDKSIRGEVIYKPISNSAITLAPIPAPSDVIKQQIGKDVVTSWKPLNSGMLAGYNVSYGRSNGFVFPTRMNNGIQIRRNMGAFPIRDTIAVTSYTAGATGIKDQIYGRESLYAYAVLAPYAGPDTAICINSSYQIINATAIDYDSLYWSTSGDGVFVNSKSLNPLYLPGKSDYKNREVYLFVTTKTKNLSIKDFAHIQFYDPPTIYAGTDTLISTDTTLRVAGARATDYSSIVWGTSGDGKFTNTNILNPVYTPGQNDIARGKVNLTVMVKSNCGSAYDTIVVQLDKGYTISGRIHAGNTLADHSQLSLYQPLGKKAYQVHKITNSTNGVFSFKAVLGGEYYLYVIPDKNITPGYVPTYFYNDVAWGNAAKIKVNTNLYDVDIDLMKARTLPAGVGSISGYCSSALGKCTEVTVLLYDKSLKYILDWKRVNDGGEFSFSDLLYGDYRLVGEKTGIPLFYSQVISLSALNPVLQQVELQCASVFYKFSLPAQPGNQNPNDIIKIYPNPFTNSLNLEGILPEGNCFVRLINSQGIVYNFTNLNFNTSQNLLYLETLPAGFFTLELWSNGVCIVRKKVVKL